MRIAQVAPPFESVPPTRYGGTERVVSLLTEELVRRGHDVTLFASGDSTTSARLIPTVDTALWRLDEVRDPLPYWAITLGEAYAPARDGEFDVVHSHLDFQAFPCAVLCATPTSRPCTGGWTCRICPPLRPLPRGGSSRSPTASGRRCPGPLAGDGLQRRRHRPPRVQPEGGELPGWLGRISPEKGLDRAIRIAKLAGLPLKVAARLPLKDTSDPTCGPTGSTTRATSSRCSGRRRSSWSARSATRRSRAPRQRPGAALPDRLAGAVRPGHGRGARLRHARWWRGGAARCPRSSSTASPA